MKRGFLLLFLLPLLSTPHLSAMGFFGSGGDQGGDHGHEGHHHGDGDATGETWFFLPWSGKGGKTNLSLNLSKGLGPFRLNANIPIGQVPTLLTLGAAAAILIITFLPIEYHVLTWLGFQLKPDEQIEKEAKHLLDATRTVYAGPLRFVRDCAFKGGEIPQPQLHRVIMKWRNTYGATQNTFYEWCRKLNWFGEYRQIVDYPYSHFENRLSNTIAWLERYHRRVKNSELRADFDDLLEHLYMLLDEVRSSYELAREKNYRRLIREIKNKDGQLLTFNVNVAP